MLSSCVYDNYIPETCFPEEGKYFLSFVLRSTTDPATKGTSDGTDIGLTQSDPGEEILVKRVDLYFYTVDGVAQGKSKANRKSYTEFKQQVASAQTDEISNVVHDILVELPYRPYVMLVLLNMEQDFAESLETLSLAQVRAKLMENNEKAWAGSKTTISYNGTPKEDVRPFRMSSSTYLNGAGNEICEVVIPEQYVWNNEPAARRNPFDVYVDRMAAKVNVVLPASLVENPIYRVPAVTQYEGLKAKVTLLGWGLNGMNRSSYVYKKINKSWNFEDWGVKWNEAAKFRSHWAQDANYDSSDASAYYPQNSGDIYGGAATKTPDDCDLKYITWKELMDSETGGKFTTPAKRTEKPLYCFENTADGGILSTKRSDNQLYPRATHVLVAAKLTFEEGTGLSSAGDVAGYTATDATLYRYKGVFYTVSNIYEALANDLARAGYTKDAAGKQKVDAACVTNLIQSYGEKWYPVLSGYYGGSPVGTADLKDTYSVDKFDKGRFYYKIPIEHLEKMPSSLGTNYPTAVYGVVRNHNYIITISEELKGIGTGISDENEPIVPVTEDRDYIVSVQITITPWKQFNTRFLFVDPSGMLITNGQRVNRWEDEGDPSVDIDDPYSWTGNGWYF